MKKWIDLRSDTVTGPTQKMREAMFTAEVGDDVYNDDPTMKELEEYAAKLVGKEAALFVPSGTFGNQLAIFTHCNRGDEVILGDDSHVVAHEVGAAAAVCSVQLRTLETVRGKMNIEKIKSTIRPGADIHWPKTGLICLENAYSDGNVVDKKYIDSVSEVADKFNIPVHMDGARLFNATTALGIEASEMLENVDTVQFCLSKGLCAPVGSIIAGPNEFIDKARYNRKMFGGGLRQAGFLAAAGLVALKEMRLRLQDDHDNAKYLASKLAEIPSITVVEEPQISMVFFKIADLKISEAELVEKLLAAGIKSNDTEGGVWRFVTHYWITKEDIDFVVKTLKEIL